VLAPVFGNQEIRTVRYHWAPAPMGLVAEVRIFDDDSPAARFRKQREEDELRATYLQIYNA
jgi:hypothetical protein